MLAEGSKTSLAGVAIAARSARSSGKGIETVLGRCTRLSVPSAVLRPRYPLNLRGFAQFIVASASAACGPEHHISLPYNLPALNVSIRYLANGAWREQVP